ncbi:MAG: UDP-2,3-diacylglucosamine hydrolase [Pseudomonadota bacterium]|nr:UDP-2,3-diacylglucosamine hydrolase [Pseudomonadota bacterium]
MITLLDGPLGVASEIHAAPHWRGIELLSDLHLGDHAPRTTQALVDHLATCQADLLVLLGDVFEAWVGDDQLDLAGDADEPLPQALQALAAAARLRPVAMLTGNRDFLLGPEAARRLGWTVLPDRCVLQAFGHRHVLVHGDAECLDDRDYQRFRAQVRSPGWREAFLARPLAERQAIARSLRDGSEQRKREQGLAGYADLDRAEMLSLLTTAGADRLIHGHTHRPGDERLGPGLSRHVLSDWDLDDLHGPARAEVLRLSAQGLHRQSLLDAS